MKRLSTPAQIAALTVSVVVVAGLAYWMWPGSRSDDGPRTDNPVVRGLVTEAAQALHGRDFAAGLALADSAARLDPQMPDVLFVRARLLFEVGRYDEAESALTALLEVDQDYPGAWHNLGNVYYSGKQFQDALDAYRKEAELHPDARAWHAVGGSYWKLGAADSSRAAYERALALDKEYAPGLLSLAEWYEAEGEYEQALTYARRAYELRPEDLDYQLKLAVLLSRTGAFDQAIPILSHVAEKRPWDYSALFSLGQSLQRIGNAEEARKALERAAVVRESEAETERLHGLVNEMPQDFELRLTLADRFRRSGRMTEARRMYEVAMAMRPANLPLRNNLAALNMQMGDTTAALSGFRAVLQRDPEFAQAWLNLAVYYAQTNQTARLSEAIARAEALAPDHPVVRRLKQGSTR